MSPNHGMPHQGSPPVHPAPLDRLLVDAGRAVQRATERAAGRQGLGATALRILAVVADRGPLGQRDLAAQAGVSPATLTPVLARLETAGALVRRRTADRRVVQATLTPHGRELLQVVSLAVTARVQERLPRPPDAAALREYLLAVVETFTADPADGPGEDGRRAG